MAEKILNFDWKTKWGKKYRCLIDSENRMGEAQQRKGEGLWKVEGMNCQNNIIDFFR